MPDESHFTDEELLMVADGELPDVRLTHLSHCWRCRARKHDMEQAIGAFVRFHRSRLDPLLPPPAGSRALLKARLAEMAPARPVRPRWEPVPNLWRAAAVFVLLLGAAAVGVRRTVPQLHSSTSVVPVSVPEPSLTPGVVILATREQVCKTDAPKNRGVPVALQRRVFEEYGISGAAPQAYEVDYLITPALGGADDIRNLWPQSYTSAVWNARVKDALEDRLHDLVCAGDVGLATAQHELAADWIAAYKKYFNTDRPIEGAR